MGLLYVLESGVFIGVMYVSFIIMCEEQQEYKTGLYLKKKKKNLQKRIESIKN
jgi:hypothetical protein